MTSMGLGTITNPMNMTLNSEKVADKFTNVFQNNFQTSNLYRSEQNFKINLNSQFGKLAQAE